MSSSGLHRLLQQRSSAYVAVVLAAAATPLAFAPYRLYWLMPLLLGVLVLFAFLQHKRAVSLAYVWGLVAYTAQNYWINIALHDVAGLPQPYALPLTLLLPLYLALYPALTFWFLEKIHLSDTWRLLLAFPALWALTEWIRARALTGFGWGALGYSQMAASPLAGFAPVGGVALVTYMVALITALLVGLLLLRPLWAKVTVTAVGVAVLIGGQMLHQHPFTHPDGTRASVGLAQGNIPQTLKWDESAFALTLQTYYEQVAASRDNILILPETAIPILLQALPSGSLSQFATTAQRNHTALAVGIIQASPDGKDYYNAVVNLSAYTPEQPDALPFYAKNHLVPFGEYMPLPQLTAPLYKMMNMPMSSLSAGGHAQAPLTLDNQKVAFNICYEDSFGDELIASAKQASLLANASNMAWYGNSAAMDLHLQQSQARALELGRYMVRATNNGMTAIINPRGEITAMAQRDTRQVLHGTIEGYSGQTPYMKMGGSRPLLLLFAELPILMWAYGLFKQERETRKAQAAL